MDIELLTIRSSAALSFVEGDRDIPFPIKRMYYIHSQPAGTHRGFHAHKALQQLLICPHGKICVLLDDGNERSEVLLDNPTKGLILRPSTWREMIWEQDDSVLCVLASDYYDESDYLREYQDFLTYIAVKKNIKKE